MRIWKYELPLKDDVKIRMPEGAKTLRVGAQGDVLCLWALVDPGARAQLLRTFRIAGTGHEIAEIERKVYIGTAETHGGAMVWHVFECLSDF